jgi:hypothetical protein
MDQKCKYGCGNQALFGDRCSVSSNSCPENKRKNSLGSKKAWKVKVPFYESIPTETKARMAWARGKTKHNDARIALMAERMTGKRRITDEERISKISYQEKCKFDLRNCIENVLGYELLIQHGMYHRINNKNGVVRDHRLSVDWGYKLGIDPKIISHPANCRFLTASENSKKSKASEIKLDELMVDIENWN